MSDETLRLLADKAGVATHWTDQGSEDRQVSPETLRAILTALGLPVTEDPNALVSLRPEQVRLDDAGVPATIRAVYFKGSHSEVEVDLSRYVYLRLLTTRSDLRVGMAVGVRVAAESVWRLKR